MYSSTCVTVLQCYSFNIPCWATHAQINNTPMACVVHLFSKGLLPRAYRCVFVFTPIFYIIVRQSLWKTQIWNKLQFNIFISIQLDSPLHRIKWLRVILDEGHTIRNPQTSLTKAMIDLVAKRRWVLTGTPIQNRLDDLWSVVKFLRLEPFDDKKWWNAALASSVRRGDEQAVK